MYHKFTALLLAALLLFLTACGSETVSSYLQTSSAAAQETALPVTLNRLTGLSDLDPDDAGKRPLAVMINNIKTAQEVQTGIGKADLVFEAMVEGGITRLMAVYADPEKVSDIGTVRSARHTYVQIAKSLDAIYVHCGMDELYTRPLVKDLGLDNFDLGAVSGDYSVRRNNGKSYEHTLYTSGSRLTKGISETNVRTKIDSADDTPFFNFVDPQEPVVPASSCLSVKVPMSDDYVTTFKYEESSHKYVRMPGGNTQVDYLTDEKIRFTNVLLLYAKTPMFDDNYHLRSILDSGTGVYCSNGGYESITWTKGNPSDPFRFQNASGTDLSVNAGNSWIFIVPDTQQSKVVFTGEQTASQGK